MEKKMEPLIVKTGDGVIWIEQCVSGAGDDMGIAVTPDQVPILIEWLQEAAKELQNGAKPTEK